MADVPALLPPSVILGPIVVPLWLLAEGVKGEGGSKQSEPVTWERTKKATSDAASTVLPYVAAVPLVRMSAQAISNVPISAVSNSASWVANFLNPTTNKFIGYIDPKTCPAVPTLDRAMNWKLLDKYMPSASRWLTEKHYLARGLSIPEMGVLVNASAARSSVLFYGGNFSSNACLILSGWNESVADREGNITRNYIRMSSGMAYFMANAGVLLANTGAFDAWTNRKLGIISSIFKLSGGAGQFAAAFQKKKTVTKDGVKYMVYDEKGDPQTEVLKCEAAKSFFQFTRDALQLGQLFLHDNYKVFGLSAKPLIENYLTPLTTTFLWMDAGATMDKAKLASACSLQFGSPYAADANKRVEKNIAKFAWADGFKIGKFKVSGFVGKAGRIGFITAVAGAGLYALDKYIFNDTKVVKWINKAVFGQDPDKKTENMYGGSMASASPPPILQQAAEFSASAFKRHSFMDTSFAGTTVPFAGTPFWQNGLSIPEAVPAPSALAAMEAPTFPDFTKFAEDVPEKPQRAARKHKPIELAVAQDVNAPNIADAPLINAVTELQPQIIEDAELGAQLMEWPTIDAGQIIDAVKLPVLPENDFSWPSAMPEMQNGELDILFAQQAAKNAARYPRFTIPENTNELSEFVPSPGDVSNIERTRAGGGSE